MLAILCFVISSGSQALAAPSLFGLHALLPAESFSLALSKSAVTGGESVSATVSCTSAAPPAGLELKLLSSHSAVTLESTVKIKPGQTSATFMVNTVAVSAVTGVVITATVGAVSQTATLTVNPPALTSVELDPKGVGGGASTTCQITVSAAAPDGGLTVALSSSKSAAQVQSNVKIPAGQTSATFAVSTSAVKAQTLATITATVAGSSQSAVLTINPVGLASTSVHPGSVKGGTTATGVVELNGPAGPGGLVLNLSSGNAAVTVPVTVTIAAGHSSATFSIGTSTVNAQTSVTLTVTLGSSTETATITLTK